MPVFLVPALGESGNDEVDVVRWLVSPGDHVDELSPLVELETAKVTLIVPSPFGGVLTDVRAEAGATVQAGEPLATIVAADGDGSGSGGP